MFFLFGIDILEQRALQFTKLIKEETKWDSINVSTLFTCPSLKKCLIVDFNLFFLLKFDFFLLGINFFLMFSC
jgi:hypothetical protein